MGNLISTNPTGSVDNPLKLGVFQRLLSVFGSFFGSRALSGFETFPAGAPSNGNAFDYGPSYALTSAAVWRCCSIIANSISTLPTNIFEQTDAGKRKAIDHPLYRLLTVAPNPAMTVQQYFQTTLLHLLLWGNAFTHIVRSSSGAVLSLWPLLPGEVRMEPTNYRTLDYYYPAKAPLPIDPANLIHFRLFTMDGLSGLSVIQYQRANFMFEHSAHSYAYTIFSNNGQRPSGYIRFPNAKKEEQVRKIRESWQQIHSTPGRVAILEEGAEYQSISAPLSDLDYMAQNQFSIEQIARIFGVPLHLLDAAQRPTYASVEQDSIEFLRYTMSPWIVCLEKSILNALLRDPYYFKFNIKGFERSDIQTRYASYAVARQWGWMSVNDIRELEDMNSIGSNGDVYLQPLNMVSAGKQTTATE
jgi:HK97 family phage portal protein